MTKHGLADALQGDNAGSDALHAYFVDRLVPVCGMLLDAARAEKGLPSHEHAPNGYNLLKGVGNLCIGAEGDSSYDADGLVQLLVSGALAGTAVSRSSTV